MVEHNVEIYETQKWNTVLLVIEKNNENQYLSPVFRRFTA